MTIDTSWFKTITFNVQKSLHFSCIIIQTDSLLYFAIKLCLFILKVTHQFLKISADRILCKYKLNLQILHLRIEYTETSGQTRDVIYILILCLEIIKMATITIVCMGVHENNRTILNNFVVQNNCSPLMNLWWKEEMNTKYAVKLLQFIFLLSTLKSIGFRSRT